MMASSNVAADAGRVLAQWGYSRITTSPGRLAADPPIRETLHKHGAIGAQFASQIGEIGLGKRAIARGAHQDEQGRVTRNDSA